MCGKKIQKKSLNNKLSDQLIVSDTYIQRIGYDIQFSVTHSWFGISG